MCAPYIRAYQKLQKMSTHLARQIGIGTPTKWDAIMNQLGELNLPEAVKHKLVGAVQQERISKYITHELRRELRTVGVQVD